MGLVKFNLELPRYSWAVCWCSRVRLVYTTRTPPRPACGESRSRHSITPAGFWTDNPELAPETIHIPEPANAGRNRASHRLLRRSLLEPLHLNGPLT